jgi:hypothetical protein
MSSTAVLLLILALVVVWGGLLVSIVVLVRQPEPTTWPEGAVDGAVDDHRQDESPAPRDT